MDLCYNHVEYFFMLAADEKVLIRAVFRFSRERPPLSMLISSDNFIKRVVLFDKRINFIIVIVFWYLLLDRFFSSFFPATSSTTLKEPPTRDTLVTSIHRGSRRGQ
jgi:hypothetical protein